MVHLYFNMDCDALGKYPDIIDDMRNCLEEIMGERHPILKINMYLTFKEAYPESEKEAVRRLREYFIFNQITQQNGWQEIKQSKEDKDMTLYEFHAQCMPREWFGKPHIEVGGINGNLSIAIRSMTDLSDDQHKAIDNKMSEIVRPYVKKEE